MVEAGTLQLALTFNDGVDDHILLHYSGTPYALLDLNAVSGAYRVTVAPTGGRLLPQCIGVHPVDGWLYIGGTGNTAYRYNPANGALESLFYYDLGSNYPYQFAPAPDGMVYFAYFSGNVAAYNPATQESTLYAGAGVSLPYSLAVGDTHVYFPLAYTPWRLAILDRTTGATSVLWTADGATYAEVKQAADWSAVYARRYVAGVWQWFRLDGETPVSVEAGAVPALMPVDYGVGLLGAAYAVDLLRATPTSTAPDVAVTWQPDVGDPITVSGIAGLPTAPVTLGAAFSVGAQIGLMPASYGVISTYNPQGKTATVQGDTGLSTRTALVNGTDVYFGMYSASTLRWDTLQPWTLYAGANTITSNPRKIAAGGSAHDRLALDGSGRVWIAVRHVRSSEGATLHRYTPDTDELLTLRETLGLEALTIEGLCVVGGHVVLSVIGAGVSNVLVVSADTGALVNTYAAPHADPGMALAIPATNAALFIHSGGAYRMNVSTGAVEWDTARAEMFGYAGYTWQRHAEIAPRGKAYVFAGNMLCAINPQSGVISDIIEDSLPNTVFWHGSSAYMLSVYTVRRIAGL